ncbi:MAG: nucleotidyltransferase family protein [Betaproteobacteria bacterium]|nr:nucleotidyltransferase family protein [Betaproteobacteria bacterium]
MTPGICGILLASGSGSRFGSDKLMHPLVPGGEPIAAHAARHLINAIPHSIAVVRSANTHLARLLRAQGLRIAVCRDAAMGMGHTLAAGVRASKKASGWVVALADMPGIRPDTIARIAAELEGGGVIVAPCHKGQRGHPVGLARRFYQDLLSLKGDAGARAIIAAHQDCVTLVEVDDHGVTKDIDTPADLPGK